MKFCTKCGNQLPDDTRFCSRCGNPMPVAAPQAPAPQVPVYQVPVTPAAPQAPVPPAAQQMPVSQIKTKKKSGKTGLVIALIAIAVVVAVVLGIVLGTSGVFDDLFGGGSSTRVDKDDDRDDDRDKDDDAGDDNQNAGAAEGPSAEMPAEMEDVSLSVIVAQYSNASSAWWEDFEAEFENTYPNIDLMIDVCSWNDIYTVVNTRIANGEAPDILNIDVFAEYKDDDLLLPVDAYMSDKTYNKFYEPFLEQSVVDGQVWAVPDLATSRALFYNRDLLDAAGIPAPTTWDELVEACAMIKEAYGIYPLGIDMTDLDGMASFAYFTMNNGGGFVDARGNWALNSPENVEAVEFMVELMENGYTNPDPTYYNRYELEDMFGAGEIAMVIAPEYLPNYLESLGSAVNCGVVPIPTNTGRSISLGFMDRFMCFDNNQSEEELYAMQLFFDFLYEEERYADWVNTEGYLPATISGMEYVAANDPEKAVWIEILDNVKFYPTYKEEWYDVRDDIVYVMQVALDGDDVQAVLDELQAAYG